MTEQSKSTAKQPAKPQPIAQPRLPKPTAVDPGVQVRAEPSIPRPKAPDSRRALHARRSASGSAGEGPGEK